MAGATKQYDLSNSMCVDNLLTDISMIADLAELVEIMTGELSPQCKLDGDDYFSRQRDRTTAAACAVTHRLVYLAEKLEAYRMQLDEKHHVDT